MSDAEHRLRGSDRGNARRCPGADISHLNKVGCRNVFECGVIFAVVVEGGFIFAVLFLERVHSRSFF